MASEPTGTAPFSPRKRSDSVSTRSGSRSSGTARRTSSAALAEGSGADLCLVSGGLGPTHDDRTVEMVARVAGRPLIVDAGLEQQIETGLAHVRRAHGQAVHRVRHRRHQAGDAPGRRALPRARGDCPRLRARHRRVGRRRGAARSSARASTPVATRAGDLARPAGAGACAGARSSGPAFLRHAGVRRRAGARRGRRRRGRRGGDDLRAGLRDPRRPGLRPGARERAEALAAFASRRALERYLFSEDGRSVAEIVLERCRARGLTLAAAESCTGGLVAARLTDVAGSSDVFRGSIVAYANDVKESELGVSRELLERHGAVSAEVARAMAHGVRERLAPTSASPSPGSPARMEAPRRSPWDSCSSMPSARTERRHVQIELPGDRETVRGRATVAALHLVRKLLENRHTGREGSRYRRGR